MDDVHTELMYGDRCWWDPLLLVLRAPGLDSALPPNPCDGRYKEEGAKLRGARFPAGERKNLEKEGAGSQIPVRGASYAGECRISNQIKERCSAEKGLLLLLGFVRPAANRSAQRIRAAGRAPCPPRRGAAANRQRIAATLLLRLRRGGERDPASSPHPSRPPHRGHSPPPFPARTPWAARCPRPAAARSPAWSC